MSTWRALEVVGVGVATVLGGVAAARGVAWLLARLGRQLGADLQIDGLIDAKGARTRFTGLDEDARRRTDLRRTLADKLRRDSRRLLTKDEHHGTERDLAGEFSGRRRDGDPPVRRPLLH